MPWNYDEIFSTAQEIIKELGFEVEDNEDGSISVFGYDNKIGSEDEFFRVIAPFIPAGQELSWVGEDGDKWTWVFNGETMAIM